MRTISKPAILFPVVAAALGLLVWLRSDVPWLASYVNDFFPDSPAVALIHLVITALITLPLIIALLRYDWRMPFIDVAVLCAGWAIAWNLAFLSDLSDSLNIRAENNVASLLLTGLLRGAVFSAITWGGAAIVASRVRVKRFAVLWLAGTPIAFAYGLTAPFMLSDSAPINVAIIGMEFIGIPIVAFILGGVLVNRVVQPQSEASVAWADVHWLLKVGASISGAAAVVTLGWLVWTRTDLYQVRQFLP